MNAAEQIVEAYLRYKRGLFTRSNVRAAGQAELDIVGVDPTTSPPTFFHVESSVSISSAYSKISNKPFNAADEKKRSGKAGQRRTAGFFIEKKFYSPNVLNTLKKIGCNLDNLKRILVSWEFDEDAKKVLDDKEIECLTMKDIFQQLADNLAEETSNIDSEILRTLQLFVRSKPEMPPIYSIQTTRRKKKE